MHEHEFKSLSEIAKIADEWAQKYTGCSSWQELKQKREQEKLEYLREKIPYDEYYYDELPTIDVLRAKKQEDCPKPDCEHVWNCPYDGWIAALTKDNQGVVEVSWMRCSVWKYNRRK